MPRIVSNGTSQPNMDLCEVKVFDRDKVIRIQYENEEQKERILKSLEKLGIKAKEAKYGW